MFLPLPGMFRPSLTSVQPRVHSIVVSHTTSGTGDPWRFLESGPAARSVLPGCAARRNFCDGRRCQNGGTCVNRWNMYLCECPLRFGGKNCEQGEWLASSIPPVVEAWEALLLDMPGTTVRGFHVRLRQPLAAYAAFTVDSLPSPRDCPLHRPRPQSLRCGVGQVGWASRAQP